MACFLVPVGEAVVTTIVQKVIEKREKKSGTEKSKTEKSGSTKLTWSRRLSWLNKMLWGGSILLAFEHVWHGELSFVPPFLTAMKSPAETAVMLHEMATFGVAMAVAITAVWGVMVLIAELKTRSASRVKAVPVAGAAE
jgi:hypothetical protein